MNERRESRGRLVLAVAVVLLLTCGLSCTLPVSICNFPPGGEDGPPPTDEDTGEDEGEEGPGPDVPSDAPSEITDPVLLEYPFGGVDLYYPRAWHTEFLGRGQLLLAESRASLGSMDFEEGPILLIFSGSPDTVPEEIGAEPTAQSMMDSLLEGFGEGSEAGEIHTRRFARQEGLGATISSTEGGESMRGFVATYADGEVTFLALAAAPAAQWDAAWPVLDAILSTAVLYAPIDAIDRGDIGLGATETATLTPGGADAWTYRSSGDEWITVGVVATDDWDPMLEVFDESGESIASDDDGGEGLNPRLSFLHLEEPGRYELRVYPFSGHGGYQITVTAEEEPAAGGGVIGYGETVSGVLTPSFPEHDWTFIGSEGDFVSISLEGTEELRDTYLELYGPGGEELTRDDDGGEGLFALISGYRLPQSGEYRIVARGFGRATGPYTLTLARMEAVERWISYGQTRSEELTATDSRHTWSFEGRAGDVVTISMIGMGSLRDTYLELYGPDGRELIRNDDGGVGLFALIEEYELPVTGTFMIIARGFAGATGRYELTLERVG